MTTGRHSLWINASMGMSGDMFAAALIGLGAEEAGLIGAMSAAAELLGGAAINVSHKMLPDGTLATQINVDSPPREPLTITDAPAVLDRGLRAAGVRGGYAGFAHRAMAILCQAERTAHAMLPDPSGTETGATVTFIGHARTPYGDRAPHQPSRDAAKVADADAFFLEMDPAYAEGLEGLDAFSHLFVLSYLERSCGYSLRVHPPWRSDGVGRGLFATRSPNRPSPVGLTRIRLRRIEGARIYTGPLDLFDGTPIIDIKPYIQSIDGSPADGVFGEDTGGDVPGNDGWLAGSDHLELHRRGVPHPHPGGGQLHEAQDILLDVVGEAWGLQYLEMDLQAVSCRRPVRVGGGTTGPTSHGRLSVPAPATRAILDAYDIPYQTGPVEAELLTPSGATILAALSPEFVVESSPSPADFRAGVGMGQCVFGPEVPNVLRLQCRGAIGTSGQ